MNAMLALTTVCPKMTRSGGGGLEGGGGWGVVLDAFRYILIVCLPAIVVILIGDLPLLLQYDIFCRLFLNY